jgi:CDP-diacylglycerol--serine O-phosphatidyltransferase
VLPTLLTLANGVCGFTAIAYASKINLDGSMPAGLVDYYFLLSSGLILAAMVFDVLDGYAARVSRSASEFGKQLDSLCDAISFGAAPGFLLLRLGQEWNNHLLVAKSIAVIAALFMACAVLRLARFNIESAPEPAPSSPPQKPAAGKRFKGLPSPAAAGCIVSLAVLRSDSTSAWTGIDEAIVHGFVRFWAPVGALMAALLMVSRLPYPHFTRQLLRGRRQFRFVVQAVVLMAVIALAPNLALFLIFWTYALMAPVRYLVSQARRQALPEHTPGLH